jgi:nucleoid DNA-binding protein
MADQSAAGAKKPLTKTEITQALADSTGLTKQQVNQVLEELTRLIGQSLGPSGAGSFTLPGLLKINTKVKPAKAAGMRKNPFTGEEVFKEAEPESRTVKVSALKGLKDMAQGS